MKGRPCKRRTETSDNAKMKYLSSPIMNESISGRVTDDTGDEIDDTG